MSSRFSNPSSEEPLNLNAREAAILAAMPKASLVEQRRLALELEKVRRQRYASLDAARSEDIASELIADTMSPVVGFTAHTAATDWVAESAPLPVGDTQLHNAAKSEATRWFRRVASAVKQDEQEFAVQASGYANIWGSQFGLDATSASESFIAQAMHLAGFRRQAADLFAVEKWCERRGMVMKDFPDALISQAAASGDFSILEDWLNDNQPYTNRSGWWGNDDGFTASRRTAADFSYKGKGYGTGFGKGSCKVCGKDVGGKESYVSLHPNGDFDKQDSICRDCGNDMQKKGSRRRTAAPQKNDRGFRSWKCRCGNVVSSYQGGDATCRSCGLEYNGSGELIQSPWAEEGHDWANDGSFVGYASRVASRKNLVWGHACAECGSSIDYYVLDDDKTFECDECGAVSKNVEKNRVPQCPDCGSSDLERWEGDTARCDDCKGIYAMSPKAKAKIASLTTTAAGEKCAVCGKTATHYAYQKGASASGHFACADHIGRYANGRTVKKIGSLTKTAARPLYEIASEIRREWRMIPNYRDKFFAAIPYLEAMEQLDSINDNFYSDSAKTIVSYFIGNVGRWSGENAKRIKAELRAMVSGKSASRRTAVSLTNVGFEGGIGSNIAYGYTADGRKLRFRLSDEDAKNIAYAMTSDMAVNFSGVDIDEKDIITGNEGQPSDSYVDWMNRQGSRRTAEWSGSSCHSCGKNNFPGVSRCNHCGVPHPGDAPIKKKKSNRHYADQGVGPSDNSQSGYGESGVPWVDVSATDTFEMGWTQDGGDDVAEAYEDAPEGSVGPFDATLRTAEWSGSECKSCGKNNYPGVSRCNHCGVPHPGDAPIKKKKSGSRKTSGLIKLNPGEYRLTCDGCGEEHPENPFSYPSSAIEEGEYDGWEFSGETDGVTIKDAYCPICAGDGSEHTASRKTAASVQHDPDDPDHTFWECNRCGSQVDRYRGEGDVECNKCGAQYNAVGQQLRDDWADNPSYYDDEIGDMEGYEMQMSRYESSLRRQAGQIVVPGVVVEQVMYDARGRFSAAELELLQNAFPEYKEYSGDSPDMQVDDSNPDVLWIILAEVEGRINTLKEMLSIGDEEDYVREDLATFRNFYRTIDRAYEKAVKANKASVSAKFRRQADDGFAGNLDGTKPSGAAPMVQPGAATDVAMFEPDELDTPIPSDAAAISEEDSYNPTTASLWDNL